MNELKGLKEQQRQALKMGDFAKLNEINKKIFTIRERARREKTRERERELEQRIADRIESMMTA